MKKKIEESQEIICCEHVKLDDIDDSEFYLREKLSHYRKEYEQKVEEYKKQKAKKLPLILQVIGVLTIIVGIILIRVQTNELFFFVADVGAVINLVGWALRPRKRMDIGEEYAPDGFKLVKPESIEPSSGGKEGYFFFVNLDEKEEFSLALTETKYTEAEKDAICRSYAEGNVVIAVNQYNAIILEY